MTAYASAALPVESPVHFRDLVTAEGIVAPGVPRTLALEMAIVARRLVVVEDDALVQLAH